jgi:hypothetical protein
MNRMLDAFRITTVSLYLLGIFSYLLFKGKLPSSAIKKALRSLVRPKYAGKIASFVNDKGFCWLASLPEHLCSDSESASRLQLFEDGHPLGPAHISHDEIRRLGGGRYSHWGAQLYFSASDNSDPDKNGRTYTVREI